MIHVSELGYSGVPKIWPIKMYMPTPSRKSNKTNSAEQTDRLHQ